MTIIEFLLARIAEDEADARGSIGMRWDGCAYQQVRTYGGDSPHYYKIVSGQVTLEHWESRDRLDPGSTFRHIARHDPARVLAECAAKRAIVEQHKDWPVLVETKPEFREYETDPQSIAYRVTQEMVWLTEREYVKRFGTEAPTTNMIRALAAVYADHPDYLQEWAL